jgi:hypothetical protein
MRWLLWRELAVMTRTRALWLTMAVQVLLLAAVLVIWGDGIPVMTGSIAHQLVAIHSTMLLGLLPWLGARCSSMAVGEMASVAALAAVPPRTVVLAQGAASAIVLLASVASTLPVHVIAMRMAASSVVLPVIAMGAIAALSVFVSAFVTTLIVFGVGRVATWVVATAVTVTIALSFGSNATAIFLAAAAGLWFMAVASGERRMRYPLARPT